MGAGGTFTIINGTPYDWRIIDPSSYQMNSWPFHAGDVIKAQTTVHLYVEFSEAIFKKWTDDSGRVDLQLMGTPETTPPQFRLQVVYQDFQAYLSGFACQNQPKGATVSLGWHHDGNTTFVLAGTWGNLVTVGQCPQWMQGALSWLGDRRLFDIALPGSHDAGMSTITGGTVWGNSCNCQNQGLDIGNQLRAGARYFDIRPVISAGGFKTGHYSDTGEPFGWQGANGQSMSDIIDQINNFCKISAELIVVRLSHALNTDSRPYKDLTQDEWNRLFSELLRIEHRFVAPVSGSDLTQLKINDFIGSGKAAVVLVVDPTNISLGSYASQGFYTSSQLCIYDEYSNTNDLNTMTNDQLNKMRQQHGHYFLLSWTLTQDSKDEVGLGPSIRDLAAKANPTLYDKFWDACRKDLIPNVVYVDFFDPLVTNLTIAVNAKATF
ncbi:PLC-like phosphodiesterase [Mycena olivaceomarginata]|nr:PLC-like phosphodiesterase [Mycena olivaceomarginata]